MATRYLQSAQSTSTLVVYDAPSGGSVSSLSNGDILELNGYVLTIDSTTWPTGITITIQNTAGGTISVSMTSAARTVNAILQAVAASTTMCTATGSATNRITVVALRGGSNTSASAMLLNTISALLTVSTDITGGNGTGTTSYGLNIGNNSQSIIVGTVTSNTSPAINLGNTASITVSPGPVTSNSIYAIGGAVGNVSTTTIAMVSGTPGWVQNTRGPAPFATGAVLLTLDGSNVYWSSDGSQFSVLANATQMAQIRSRLGLDGTQATPTCQTSTLVMASTQSFTNTSSLESLMKSQTDKIGTTSGDSSSVTAGMLQIASINSGILRDKTGFYLASNQTFDQLGNLNGDVKGKILGGGVSIITGVGTRAVDQSGNSLATSDQVDAVLYAQVRIRMAIPEQLEIPDSGNIDYDLSVNSYDADGVSADCDEAPTVHAFYANGSSADAQITMSPTKIATGSYRWRFRVTSGFESPTYIRFTVDGIMGAQPLSMSDYTWLVDATQIDFTPDDRNTLQYIAGQTDGKISDIPAAVGTQITEDHGTGSYYSGNIDLSGLVTDVRDAITEDHGTGSYYSGSTQPVTIEVADGVIIEGSSNGVVGRTIEGG